MVKVLSDHYSPKLSEIVSRFEFYNRSRKPGESVSVFIAEIQALSQFCDFGDSLDTMVRDHLVNPADIPSCSCLGQNLIDKELWWKELDFLRKSIEFWPELPTKFESIVAEVERVHNPPVITYSLVHLS